MKGGVEEKMRKSVFYAQESHISFGKCQVSAHVTGREGDTILASTQGELLSADAEINHAWVNEYNITHSVFTIQGYALSNWVEGLSDEAFYPWESPPKKST